MQRKPKTSSTQQKILIGTTCWVVIFIVFYLIYLSNTSQQPTGTSVVKSQIVNYGVKQNNVDEPKLNDAKLAVIPTPIKQDIKETIKEDIKEDIKQGESASKHDDVEALTSIINTKKFCVSNEILYFGQLTHNGNLNGQMKQIYETVHTRRKLPFLKKENTFLFTDTEPSQEFIGNFPRITFRASKVQEKGYGGAQKRFLESIFTMLEIKKERNDEKVRWFMISDDDHFVIPANLMKTLAKYDHLLDKGVLSLDKPLIIGRTPSCLHVSGGAGVIFNQKAIEVVSVHINKCIQTFGLQWYDYTIYRCVNEVITDSTEKKCEILKHETSMHCCNYMYFCDTSSFNDPPNLSWFNRFRHATGIHYIQGGENIQRVKENIPEKLFTQVDTCFDIKDLEHELDGYMIGSGSNTGDSKTLNDIMKRVTKLKIPKQIDWALKEEKQADSETVSNFMINLIEIVYSSWENQQLSNRQAIENNLEKQEISILLIPSTHIKSHPLIDTTYDPKNNIQSSIQYWKENGFTIHTCNTNSSKLSLYGECFKQVQDDKFKWTIVVTETTRVNVNTLLSYLKTYKSDEVKFIGAMSSGLQLILSQLEEKDSQIIGLPFGSTFSVSKPFIREYLSIYNSAQTNLEKQSKINEELLKPNSQMLLSGGQFFKHAPEHYCTRGIQNLDSWIEMQVPTKFVEPISVTLTPTNNCNGRLNTIHQFLNRNDRTLLTSSSGFAHHCFE